MRSGAGVCVCVSMSACCVRALQNNLYNRTAAWPLQTTVPDGFVTGTVCTRFCCRQAVPDSKLSVHMGIRHK